MREISKWLMHDEQKDLFEILLASVLTILFLALIALLFWLLGRPAMAFRLAKGYGVLWLVILIVTVLVNRLQRFFRIDIHTHADAYVNSNLAVSCFLQGGWSAFAALTVHSFVASVPIWLMLVLYTVGMLSCLIAFFAVSAFYQGRIYKLISLPVALIGFLVFSVWPAGGRAIYGWFFNLFGF
jgi:hypothetical protein